MPIDQTFQEAHGRETFHYSLMRIMLSSKSNKLNDLIYLKMG